MTQAANAPLMVSLPPVRVLTMNLGAVRITRDKEGSKADELWRGSGFGPDGLDVPIYLRLSSPLPAVAELVCAVIGRAMQLPVPEPYLVQVPPGTLPGSRFVDATSAVRWCFASQDLGGASFAQLLRGDSASAQAMLLRWQHLWPTSVFDEWLANGDRNPGNLVYAAQALWMIDHANALGGSARELFELKEIVGDTFRNLLGDVFAAAATVTRRKRALDQAQQWLNSVAATVDLPEAIVCCKAELLQDMGQCEELLDFLEHRLTLTHALLCNRLGHNQLPLHPPPTKAGEQARAGAPAASAPSSSSPRR